MKKRIDWLNHGLEFIVVIVGILIAFQLNQCSAEKNQKKTIKIHLEQIQKEAEHNKTVLESSKNFTEAGNKKIDSILHLINTNEKYDLVNWLSVQLLSISSPDLRKNAYISLTESGDIKFLKDFKKKQQIIDLYEFYKWVEASDEVSYMLYTKDFYPYLRDNFDLIYNEIQKESTYNNKLYLNILSSYKITNENKIAIYKECLKEVEKYLNN